MALLPGLVSVSSSPLWRAVGRASNASIAPLQLGASGRLYDDVICSPASSLAACAEDLSVLAQGPVPYGGPGTGHHTHPGFPSTSVHLPLLMEFWVHPGCGLGRVGRHALEQSF